MKSRNLAKECDIVIMYSIFAIALLNLFYIIGHEIWILNPRKGFAISAHIELLILGSCLIWKAYRLGSCLYTRVAVWLYVIYLLTGLIYVIHPFGFHIVSKINTYLFCCATMLLFSVFLTKLVLKRCKTAPTQKGTSLPGEVV